MLKYELTNLGLAEPAMVREPVKVRNSNYDTYGSGVDVDKVNKLIKKVSGRGLAIFN